MASEAMLVQSSPKTRSCMQSLRDRLPLLQYNEVKYWASFRSAPPRRVVAYLNPSKQGVRVFLALGPDSEADLVQTPSTSSWAARFPSVFQIDGEQDLERAEQLILASSKVIKPSGREKAYPRPEYYAAEELPPEAEYLEGSASRVLVNAYERNRRARETCLRHCGRSCVACGFNFRDNYGESTAGYIHVHHVVPISRVGTGYRLHPINDLRPLCPNCHAVIHLKEPPFSIEDVKQMLRNGDAKA